MIPCSQSFTSPACRNRVWSRGRPSNNRRGQDSGQTEAEAGPETAKWEDRAVRGVREPPPRSPRLSPVTSSSHHSVLAFNFRICNTSLLTCVKITNSVIKYNFHVLSQITKQRPIQSCRSAPLEENAHRKPSGTAKRLTSDSVPY